MPSAIFSQMNSCQFRLIFTAIKSLQIEIFSCTFAQDALARRNKYAKCNFSQMKTFPTGMSETLIFLTVRAHFIDITSLQSLDTTLQLQLGASLSS